MGRDTLAIPALKMKLNFGELQGRQKPVGITAQPKLTKNNFVSAELMRVAHGHNGDNAIRAYVPNNGATDMTDLHSLHKAAMAAFHAKRTFSPPAARPVKRLSTLTVEPAVSYSDPAMWRAGEAITLLHDETSTLLGVFIEWRHTRDASARKLLPPTGPCIPSRVERYTGTWLPVGIVAEDIRAIDGHHGGIERATCILPLSLDSLGVHSPLVEVEVTLQDTYLLRATLATPTQFIHLPGRGDQLLDLPAGTNILPLLGLESKIALRAEAQKGDST